MHEILIHYETPLLHTHTHTFTHIVHTCNTFYAHCYTCKYTQSVLLYCQGFQINLRKIYPWTNNEVKPPVQCLPKFQTMFLGNLICSRLPGFLIIEALHVPNHLHTHPPPHTHTHTHTHMHTHIRTHIYAFWKYQHVYILLINDYILESILNAIFLILLPIKFMKGEAS